MWQPETSAEAIGVRVAETHNLPLGLLGAWQPDRRTIWLQPGLRPRQRRSVVGHEIVHAERSDGTCTLDLLARKRERVVEDLAARRLITLAELGGALQVCHSMHDLANELCVDLSMAHRRVDLARADRCESAYLDQCVAGREGISPMHRERRA